MPAAGAPGPKFPRVATPGSLQHGSPSSPPPGAIPPASMPAVVRVPQKPAPVVAPPPAPVAPPPTTSFPSAPPPPVVAPPLSPNLTSPPGTDRYIGRLVAGKFEVKELIGQGGMGKVYKARHVSLDKMVCLKTLKPALLADETVVSRFEREAKSASRLDHPNGIHILDFGTDESGAMYIAMEFVEGKDLRKVLRDEFPLGESRTCHIVAQVLAALVRAHDLGIVHRDLKPENVLVSQRPDAPDFVKVLDFGIAKILETGGPGLTLADTVCGTPEYMAPENARGEAIDGRADLYSVGVMLYQLVTGTLPFEGRSPIEIMRHHAETPPEPPNKRKPLCCSPELEALVLRALAKDPTQRPQTAREFRDELLGLGRAARSREGGLPESIPPPTRSRPPGFSTPSASSLPSDPAIEAGLPRTPWGLILAGLVVVSVFAAAAWFVFQPVPPPPEPQKPDPVALARNAATLVIESKQADVQACFLKANTKLGAESGQLVLSIVIGPGGDVDSSAIVESTVTAPKLASCLMQKVALWKFAPPPVPALQVKYTYMFRHK